MRGGPQGSVLRSLETLFGAGSATGMSDRELLVRFLARRDEGAEAAFAALVARHGPLVWSVCRSMSSDAHAAEDAFQATFLILVRKAGSIRRRETLGPWLYGVARRVAVRAKVASRRRRQQEERGAEMKANSQPVLTPQEELEALHEEIGRLPEKYRSAVVLCHLEGSTHAEAARVLKCPTGTVNVRVSRARELLRDRLARRGLAFSTVLAGAALVAESATAAMPVGLAETTIKAAMQVAAGKSVTTGAVSAVAAQLTEGVLKTMTLTKITVAAALILAAGSVSSGIAFVAMGPAAANRAQDPNAQKEESRPKAGKKERDQSINNLKMIALAMHNFASRTDDTRFPPPAIRKDGKPLLSWRVAILPYIDQQGQALYDKFHLDEPWNSPHNRTLLNQMPDVYAPVVRTDEPRGSTYYQVFTGPGALFEDELGPKVLVDIKDGSSNTIMVVEGGSPVPWTKPEDISYDKEKPLPKLGRQFDDGFHVGFADGSVRFVGNATDPDIVRRFITRSGGEITTADMLRDQPLPAAVGAAQDPPAPKKESGPIDANKARVQSINNLKMIALAMHNVAASTNETRFAAAAIRKDGKPLLSWRVAILPYLDQKALYDKFHLDEPWNSPHNKTLLNQMPDVYAPVLRTDEPRGSTYYQVFTGPGALFEDELGPKLVDVTDGTSNTFMVVDAGSPVPWTKPEDVSYDKAKPLPKLGRLFDDGFHVAFADGSVRFVGNWNDPEIIRRFITRNGGEIIGGDTLRPDPPPAEE
jgi:RNA polymerase sigma factor (sigma-70 family)